MNPDSRKKIMAADRLPFVGLLVFCIIYYVWLCWEFVPSLLWDQGWFLQVSRRVAGGELLYKDILWPYGPLPVFGMSWLMTLGNHDIVYFSLLYATLATTATLVLYFINRYALSPATSAFWALLVMAGLGTQVSFVRAYTPGVSLGALGMLLSLLGLLDLLYRRSRLSGIFMVSLGLAVSLFAKIEYAFQCLLLTVFVLVMERIVRIMPSSDLRFSRYVALGLGVGLLVGVSGYSYLATLVGWSPLLAGLGEYDLLRVFGLGFLGYEGLTSWEAVLTALILVAAFALGLLATVSPTSVRPVLRLGISICAVGLTLSYIIVVTTWRTGALSLFRHDAISNLNLALLLNSVRNLDGERLLWFIQRQIYQVVLLSVGLLLLVLVPRWIKRAWLRESVSVEQFACLTAAVYTLIIGLRLFFWGLNMLVMTGLVLLFTVVRSEFPNVDFSMKAGGRSRSIFLATIVAIFCVNGIGMTLRYSIIDAYQIDSPYGAVLVDQRTQAVVVQVVKYVNENSEENDYLDVMGWLPGLYYLTERRNPFRQDYLFIGIGDTAQDAQDYLDRLDLFKPEIVLVAQGEWNLGILQLHGSDSLLIQSTQHRLFDGASAQIEGYLLDHYQFDRFLGSADFLELAAFKRIR